MPNAQEFHDGAIIATPVLKRLSDVTPRPVEWLWSGRFAIGKLTLIAGDPGLGKSFVTLDMAARVSTGTPWPDRRGDPIPAGDVILLSAEDDLEDTIRPRLDAAGADVTRITAIQGVNYYDPDTQRDTIKSFNLEVDLPALESAIGKSTDCRLIVVDPISAYCGRADGHKNTDVRALLAPLAKLAADHRVAVVAVTHLNKGGGANALYRAMGSLAFVAAARAVWLVTKDADNPSRRLFLPAKNNLAPDDRTGLAYSLFANGPDDAAVVAWEADPVTIRADEALAAESGCSSDRTTALAEAVAWLRDQLADGSKPAKTVKEAAEADGIAKRTLDRAKADLGVEATRDGFSGPWVWKLPECHSAPTESEERQPNGMAHYGDFGALCDDDTNPTPTDLPTIPDGWQSPAWAVELERKADCCE
ncbi:MAG: AAA family ATPase, partial [Phycisphaerales bacterium]|nr:AAA family ATPase [Phycisphaerales bacterium]